MAFCCPAVGGFFRVFVTHGNLRDSAAIATSLLLIVLASVLLGTALPFALVRLKVDPAHAGSSIQVDDLVLSGCTPAVRPLVAYARGHVLPLHKASLLLSTPALLHRTVWRRCCHSPLFGPQLSAGSRPRHNTFYS